VKDFTAYTEVFCRLSLWYHVTDMRLHWSSVQCWPFVRTDTLWIDRSYWFDIPYVTSVLCVWWKSIQEHYD